jgi:hypothetical protein
VAFKALCLLAIVVGFILITLPFSQEWGGYARMSLMFTPMLVAVIGGIIFPIKARNKVFWVVWSIILVLVAFLAIQVILP